MSLNSLRNNLTAQLAKVYTLNDPAHQIKHFNAVELCGNVINERLDLGYDPKMIMLVAYLHDMFAWSRFNHHLLSHQYVMTTDLEIVTSLSDVERLMVAAGCKEHRASYKGEFSCMFSELMNSADRELPGDVETMVKRAVQYRLKESNTLNYAAARDLVLPDAIAHIKEKFGIGGYARYPDFYLRCFSSELAQQRQDIKNL